MTVLPASSVRPQLEAVRCHTVTRAEKTVVDSAVNDNKLLASRRVHVHTSRACVRACVRRQSRASLCQSVPLPGCDVDAHSDRTLLSAGCARPNPSARRGTIKTRAITPGSSPQWRGMFRRSCSLCNRRQHGGASPTPLSVSAAGPPRCRCVSCSAGRLRGSTGRL